MVGENTKKTAKSVRTSLFSIPGGMHPRDLSRSYRFGEHKSLFFDIGLEFHRVRSFDPMRDKFHRIMKKSRPDKPMVAEARETKEVPVLVVGDLSSSIWFGLDEEVEEGERILSDREWLMLWTVGSIGRITSAVQDRLGFIGFDDDVIMDLRPKSGANYADHILSEIEGFISHLKNPTGRRADIENVLDYIVRNYSTPSLIILVSDFIGWENIYNSELIKRLFARKHDISCIILDDPNSIPNIKGLGTRSIRLKNVEVEKGKGEIVVSLRKLRKKKKEALRSRTMMIRELEKRDVDTAVLSYGSHEDGLAGFLEKRKDRCR